jgi:muconate cycloisomerase
VQGESPEELASHATELKAAGCKVIYVKIGRGEALDMAIVHAVRAAIGDSRLRLDANEAWDVLTAARMTRALALFNPEMIEQPTNSEHPAALARVKANSPIPIAADQGVFTPADVYGVCTSGSADLIVLGLHEAGSIARFQKAAAIAEVAGLNLCIHGKMESGITTCASNQVAATIANLDDGNQYMNGLLAEDIVKQPALTLENGALPLSKLPGLGFEVDTDAIGQAAERYRIEHEKGQI